MARNTPRMHGCASICGRHLLGLQPGCNCLKLGECRGEVLNDLAGEEFGGSAPGLVDTRG